MRHEQFQRLLNTRKFNHTHIVPKDFEYCYADLCSEELLKYLSEPSDKSTVRFIDGGKYCKVIVPRSEKAKIFDNRELLEMKGLMMYIFCRKIRKNIFKKYSMRRRRWPTKE